MNNTKENLLYFTILIALLSTIGFSAAAVKTGNNSLFGYAGVCIIALIVLFTLTNAWENFFSKKEEVSVNKVPDKLEPKGE